MKLTAEHHYIDIPDLNRFRIGDKVRVDYPEWERTEAVIIGIELRREHGVFKPDITILHDGDQITDGFEPRHLFKVEEPKAVAPTTHDYVPNKRYPWFCAHCGYPEHERLKHTQATAQTPRKALEGATHE